MIIGLTSHVRVQFDGELSQVMIVSMRLAGVRRRKKSHYALCPCYHYRFTSTVEGYIHKPVFMSPERLNNDVASVLYPWQTHHLTMLAWTMPALPGDVDILETRESGSTVYYTGISLVIFIMRS